jgi:hypothetical protein
MDGVAAGSFEHRGEGAGLFDVPASLHLVGAGYAYGDRPVGDRLPNSLEYLKRKTRAILQGFAIRIVTLIGRR